MNCFRKVLENVFHCLDLDGDRLLSRSEFELFHATSSGEPLDDAMWRVIKGKCEMFISCFWLFYFLLKIRMHTKEQVEILSLMQRLNNHGQIKNNCTS